jgi:uncharacterized protein RhaS with RHS repeats
VIAVEWGPAAAKARAAFTGQAPAPASSTITRDADDAVQTVSVEGRPTVTINRGPDGRITSITSSERTVTIDKDVDGLVVGTTVREP